MRRLKWIMTDKDEEFSNQLIKDFLLVIASILQQVFGFEISEKYDEEEVPHYHMNVGYISENYKSIYKKSIGYEATTNGKNYSGTINIIVYANVSKNIGEMLLAVLFMLYDNSVSKYYPEWVTTYKD